MSACTSLPAGVTGESTLESQVKIALFNVKYSPNLGDGIVAECLEHELPRMIPGARVTSFDLAGRTDWTDPGSGRLRTVKLVLLQALPSWCRDFVVDVALGTTLRRRLRSFWRAALNNVDVAVFGGGQLIQDKDLNFPLKLDAAVGECRRARVPHAVYGVGASASTSSRGRRLLGGFLKGAVFVAARDPASASILADFGCNHVVLGRDPGLLAADVWPTEVRQARSRRRVGICITHPSVLRHHGEGVVAGGDNAIALRYARLAVLLSDQNYQVRLFSNGAGEDETFLDLVERHVRKAEPSPKSIGRARRSARPEELARLISHLDAVIAHRLHACILAYAYRVPHIGLLWDSKLLTFLASVDRSDYAIELSDDCLTAIVDLVERSLAEGIEPTSHERTVNEARRGIERLSGALTNLALARISAPAQQPVATRASAWG